MSQSTEDPYIDLFRGVDEFVNEALGIKSYSHRSAHLAFLNNGLTEFDGVGFVAGLLDRLAQNWDMAVARLEKPPSTANWRWYEPQLGIASHNTSAEVTLERALVQACRKLDLQDWSNQVPIVSGMAGPYAYRRRAIDLVHQREPKAFDLAELKIKSDTPLFATVEILVYGLMWFLSRRDRAKLGYLDRDLLESKDVRLCVLAPLAFYRGLDHHWLAEKIDTGLAAVGRGQNIKFGFVIQAFPENFKWPGEYSEQDLYGMFKDRAAI